MSLKNELANLPCEKYVIVREHADLLTQNRTTYSAGSGGQADRPRQAPDTIPCPQCAGTGRAGLSPILQETLDRVRAEGPLTTRMLFESTPTGYCATTATRFNQRLENLRKHGFLTREKRGRAWWYTAVG